MFQLFVSLDLESQSVSSYLHQVWWSPLCGTSSSDHSITEDLVHDFIHLVLVSHVVCRTPKQISQASGRGPKLEVKSTCTLKTGQLVFFMTLIQTCVNSIGH